MKLTIRDISWGINRKTGDMSEKEVDKKTFDVTLGELGPIGFYQAFFTVTEMSENAITITVNKQGKTATIEKGNSYIYRPRSFDGGHYFIFELS